MAKFGNALVGMFACNGSLYKFTSHPNEKPPLQETLLNYRLSDDKHSFIEGESINSSIIAQRGDSPSVHCAKSCFHAETGTVNPFIVLKNQGRCDSYVLYTLDSNGLSEIGTFSDNFQGDKSQKADTDGEQGLSESQICTQVFSTFRPTQTQHRRVSGTTDKVLSLSLLDGPCICCFTQDQLYYSVKLQKDFMGTVPFSKAQLPISIKDFQVLCLKYHDDKLIVLGTAVTPSNSKSVECPSRQFASFLITVDNIDSTDCPTQSCNSGAVQLLQEQAFVPDIYSDVAVCATISSCHFESEEKQPERSTQITSTQIFIGNATNTKTITKCDNITYICTSLKQLVLFENRAVKNCVDITVDCGREIKTFETFTGQEFIIVEATNWKVVLVSEATFQVTNVFDNVAATFIDDFASNGADQLLIVFKETEQETRQQNGLQAFVLTDCEGIHVDNQRQLMNSNGSSSDIHESLQSTVTALQARLQAAYSSLHGATRLRDLKEQVIDELCLTIQKTAIDGQTNTNHIKSTDSLVTLIRDPQQNVDSGPGKPISMDVDTDDATFGTQTFGNSVKTTAPNIVKDNTAEGPEVSKLWQKLVTPDTWVIGVQVTNTTERSFHGFSLAAFHDCKVTSAPSLTSRSKGLEVHCTRPTGDIESPRVKRPRAVDIMSSCPSGVLMPGSNMYVTMVTDIPKFIEQQITLSLILSWLELVMDDHKLDDTGAKTLKKFSKNCGEVTININEVLDNNHAVWLKASDLETEDHLEHCQSLLCLDSVQEPLKLDVTAIFSSLSQVLPRSLDYLGFVYKPVLGSYLCMEPQSRLGFCRVKLPKLMAPLNTQITIFSRDTNQLLEVIHAVYSKLPKDVKLLPAQENPPTIELKELLCTLSAELSHAEEDMMQVFVEKPEDIQENTSKATSALKKLFEAKKSQMETQQPAKVDPAKYRQFITERSRLREGSDRAFTNFAYVCHQ